MAKEITKRIENQDFYRALIDELQATMVETIFNSRMEVLKGKWMVGQSIEDAIEDFGRSEIYGSKINSLLAKDLNWSEREIARCRQFYRKYVSKSWDKILLKLPGGKNISWHKIVVQYLPTVSSNIKETKRYISCLVDESGKIIYIKDKYRKYKIKYFESN